MHSKCKWLKFKDEHKGLVWRGRCGGWPGGCPAAPVVSSHPHVALQETGRVNLARGPRPWSWVRRVHPCAAVRPLLWDRGIAGHR